MINTSGDEHPCDQHVSIFEDYKVTILGQQWLLAVEIMDMPALP